MGREPLKVVVITGASAGFGSAFAKEAARRKYRLALVARRRDKLEATAEECRALGTEVLTIVADLEHPASLPRIVEETVARFGQIDVLINNAGFGLPNLFADSDAAAIRSQLEVNLVAPMMLTHLALPYLLKTKGVVINIGSAITAVPNPALGAYGATKSALAYWSLALRRELRHLGLKVCLVEPGPIKTEFFESLTLRNRAGESHHPMLDAPAPWMSGNLEVAARRVIGLIEKPKARLSVPKRFVWPWRLVGGVFGLFPRLGEEAVCLMIRYHDDRIDRSKARASNVD